MEVHHHPNVEKKNFKEYFLEFLTDISCGNTGFFCREYQGTISLIKKRKSNT